MTYYHPTTFVAAERHLQRTPLARLAAVAKGCGVSAATLSRAVRGETGLSYRLWQQSHIQTKAEALLRQVPSRSVKEISAELGFASQQSFARWLRRQCGIAPVSYRLLAGDRPCRGDVLDETAREPSRRLKKATSSDNDT